MRSSTSHEPVPVYTCRTSTAVMLSVSDAVKKKMLLCQRNSAGRNTPIGANAIRLPARLSTTSRSEILP